MSVHSATVEPLPTAFDVALVPEALRADDAFDQADAYLAALAALRLDGDDALAAFRNKPRTDLSLSVLQTLFNDSNRTRALQLLKDRRTITYDATHAIDVHPHNMYWNTEESFLDMLVCVGHGMGLAPLIPPLAAHHNFSFKLDLSKTGRPFTAKHFKLSFDPTASMMWIGRTGAGEDAWLAFVPPHTQDVFLDDDVPIPDPNSNAPCITRLSPPQQNRVKMFLFHCLATIRFRDTVVYEQYPDDTDNVNFSFATNIRDDSLDLNFAELQSLSAAIQVQYPIWVEYAPDQYKDDTFLTHRIPICVSSRFGQNQQIGVNIPQEMLTWDRDKDWENIRYVNIAVATRIRVQHVDRWYPALVDDLEDAYPEGIFDSPHQQDRNRLSTEALVNILQQPAPLTYPHLYSNRGYIIDSHDPAYFPASRPYALLLKARALQHAFAPLPQPNLFAQDPDPYDQAAPPLPSTSTPFYFYPQAGLRTVGHFQAHGLISQCYPIVARINRRLHFDNIRLRDRPDNITPPHNDTYYSSPAVPVIHPIASQGYNAIMHHTRGRSAQHHDAQLGLVTGALAGQWASPGTSSARAADILLQRCSAQMPHVAFDHKIQPRDLPRDLRMENVYCIDMLALHPASRKGSVILDEVISPLLRIWDHASTRAILEQHVQLFYPDSFPALYAWTTYPLTALLDRLFYLARLSFPDNKFNHTLYVELASVLERALNYMHTGNAAVIASSLMTPLWIGKALVLDGFPCLNPDIVNIINGLTIDIAPLNWPLLPGSSNPVSSSRATQLFRYDAKHFNTFYAYLGMGIVISKPPPPFITESNELRKRAIAIMVYCITLFISDCKDLVLHHISPEIKSQLRSPLPISHYGQLRSDALKQWRAADHPLAYGPDGGSTYALLLSALSPNPTAPTPRPFNAQEPISYRDLAIRIINADPDARSLSAPLWKKGAFPMALHIAKKEITHLLSVPTPDSQHVIPNILALTLRALNVSFVPWHRPSITPRSTSHVVSPAFWIQIDRANPSQPSPSSSLPTVPLSIVRQVAANTTLLNKSSDWNVPSKLSRMLPYWDKTVLPLDWNINNARLEKDKKPYVEETYVWVGIHYSRANWRHHMALVWSILITAVLPRIFVPQEFRDSVDQTASPNEITTHIRNWPWVHNPSKKRGLTQPAPFVTMVTTYIMAILDESSPLIDGRDIRREGLGPHWTSKHSAKYIHTLNLIRMGIAEPINTTGVLKTAKFRDNYQIVPEVQLKALYDRVMNYLRDPDYGVYLAIREIFGQTMADTIVQEGHSKKPAAHGSQPMEY